HHNTVHHNSVRTQDKQYKSRRIPLHRARRKSKPTPIAAISVSFLFHALRKLLLSPHDQQYLSSYTHYTDYAQVSRACLYRNCISARQGKALTARRLHDTLIQHGVGNFYEAGDVGSDSQISRLSRLRGGFPCVLEDRGHNVA